MRAALFCSALASVLLFNACGSSCPDKAALQTDPFNCGACGKVCAAGLGCADGVCTTVCPTGSTACGAVCVDTATDQANCGGCGLQCASGQACSSGACGASCLAGFTVCGDGGGSLSCANLLTDTANCGTCGSPCPAGSMCNGNGKCAESCASGFSVCGAQSEAAYCANFTTDNQNCGSCTAPCASGEACSAGKCATSCAAGYNSCGSDGGVGICADFLTDSNNCGSCGKACPTGQSCTGGTCAETCAAGFNACGGGDGGAPFCANFLTDTNNCGACAKPCPGGQICNGSGVCSETCAASFSACPDAGAGPYCADVTDDANNCGMCGKACAGGSTCKGSVCDETCAKGFSVCSNAYCADLTSDVNNCGTCGTNCANTFTAPGCCGSTCTSLASGDVNNCGVCGKACTQGTTPGCCGAGCVDESNDPSNCGACDNVCSFDLCLDGNCCSEACGTDSLTKCPGSCAAKTGVCQHAACGAGYGCNNAATCQTSCNSNADCVGDGGYTCWAAPGGSCCLPVATGATVYVDGKTGADTNCCDSATTACQTLTYAMGQIAAAGATGVTIVATWNGDPKTEADWAPNAGETWPIHLGYGVTLQGAGIFFTPPIPAVGKTAVDAFDVYSYAAGDTGTVTIEGTATDYMFIGFNSRQKNLTGTAVAVNDGVGGQTSVPLVLNKVWMNGQTDALNIGSGATVSLGPSKVIIGSGASEAKPLPLVMSPGSGIVCHGASGSLATLTDLDAGGSGVLEVDQQDTKQPGGVYTFADIYAYDYCTITLSQSPIIGVPPPCPSPKVDGEGIEVLGGSTVTLTGAIVQCMYQHGIDVGEVPAGSSFTGTPTLSLDSTLIQYTGQTGLKGVGGAVGPVTNSSVFHCRFGAVLDGTGSMDLSGGGNIAACNTDKEPGYFNVANPALVLAGINVWNDSTNNTSINASNMLWDNNPPGYWACSDGAGATSASTCSCSTGTCMGTNIIAPDNADALTNANTNAVPINLSDAGLQSTFSCN